MCHRVLNAPLQLFEQWCSKKSLIITLFVYSKGLGVYSTKYLTEEFLKTLKGFEYNFYELQVPATRENLASLPNTLSALCLNARGLEAFIKCKPFERLFQILISPEYLPAMKRKRSSDPQGVFPANIYMFKLNHRNTRKKCEICSKLTIKYQNDVSDVVLIFLLLTFNIFYTFFYFQRFYC